MKLFSKYLMLLAVCLGILVTHTTCSDSEKEKDNRTVFNYNEMAGVTSLDPATANNIEDIWPVNQLFNGLVQMDDSLKVIPCIAKSWNISEDGLVYTFNLKDNVFFHDNKCFENSKHIR